MSTVSFFRVALRLWLPSTRERRYRAALATLLSSHAFAQLQQSDRAKVDDELVAIYKPFGIYPWWRFRRDASQDAMAGDRAIAMWRLGLPTGVPELEWAAVLHPWHRESPAQLAQDFRPRHPTTEEALKFLGEPGMSLPPGKNFSLH